MAPFFFFITFFSLLTTPICHAQTTCITQKFTNNKLYNRKPLQRLTSPHFLPPLVPRRFKKHSINRLPRPSIHHQRMDRLGHKPHRRRMAGAQALLAFKASNGSIVVKTYNISSYSSIVEGKLAFDVKDKRAEYSDGMMKIFATVELPEKGATTLNQVWQVGPSVSADGFPAKHAFQPANLGAKARLDLLSGQSSGGGTGGDSRTKKRNIHGILNAVSWGILFPLGVIMARYLQTFPSADPTWFYLHASCQVSSYAIGVAGWGTGIKLGTQSKGVTYHSHRIIGIVLFSLATVQIFALFLRPKKDHKFRFYWNIYHHGIGYAILVLGIINVFKGFDILSPESKWRVAYIIVISTLGAIALVLEVITWIVILRRKSNKSTKPYGNKQQPPLTT